MHPHHRQRRSILSAYFPLTDLHQACHDRHILLHSRDIVHLRNFGVHRKFYVGCGYGADMGRDSWTKTFRDHPPRPRSLYCPAVGGLAEGYPYGFLVADSRYASIAKQPVLIGPLSTGSPRQPDRLDTLLHFDLPVTPHRISYPPARESIGMGMAC